MNLGFDVSQQLQQKQMPQTILYAEVLPLNMMALKDFLRTELEQNPFLDESMDIDMDADERLEEEAATERELLEERFELERGSGDEPIDKPDGDEGIDWEEYLSEEGLDPGYSCNREIDPNDERYEAEPVCEETLEEHLEKQLSEKKLRKPIRLLVEFLIDSLDDDGYLSLEVSEVAEAAQAAQATQAASGTEYDVDKALVVAEAARATKYDVEEALNVLWRLDPAGVGARDPRECMILQLRARGMHESMALAIVTDYWELLKKRRIPEIARQLGVEPREVQEAIDGVLKTLDLNPGGQYAGKSSTIIPDLIVEKVDGEFIVILNDNMVPSLYLTNSNYANMIRRGSKANNEAKEYVRRKFDRAKWLIDAIKSRRSTMLKVMNAIIECQKTFFEKGPPNIKPLTMEMVAEMIGMDPSTVSRVANNKYVQTRHGIFKLRSFFTAAVGQRGQGSSGDSPEDSGADVTAERVKNRIRQIIEDEDPKLPTSDQKIAEILEKENLPAARRTVAKYREQMKIPAARMRQKYD